MIYGTKLKELIYKNGYTLTKLNEVLNQINGTHKTPQNLSSKINRETLKYTEVLQILNIIGYEVVYAPKVKENKVSDKNNEYADEIGCFTFIKRGE